MSTISKNISLSAIESRIDSIFSMAKICHWTSTELNNTLNEAIVKPLDYRYPNGQRKFTSYFRGFSYGIIWAKRSYIMQNLVEFCYEIDGVLYSTHRITDKRSTKEFYDSGRGSELANYKGNFYWKNSNKPFTVTEDESQGEDNE